MNEIDPHVSFEPTPNWYREIDMGWVLVEYPNRGEVSVKTRMVFDRSPTSSGFYAFGPRTPIS